MLVVKIYVACLVIQYSNIFNTQVHKCTTYINMQYVQYKKNSITYQPPLKSRVEMVPLQCYVKLDAERVNSSRETKQFITKD